MKRYKSFTEWLKENTTHEPLVKPREKEKEREKEHVPHKTPFRPKPKTSPKPKALVNLLERVVTYDGPDRMHPHIENKFNTQNHALGTNKAFPDDEPDQKFSELMASTRFKEVIERLRRYLKINTEILNMMDVIRIMQETLAKVKDIESQNAEKLEKLAVELIKKEFDLSDEDITFEAKLKTEELVDIGDIDIEETEEDILDFEDFDIELQKRKILNGLVHGSAVKAQYAYFFIEDELEKIHKGLTDMYSILSILSEYGYWVVPTQNANLAVGKVKVKIDNGEPVVMVTSISFPYLVHELAKGVVEVMTQHDDYLNDKQREQIRGKADNLENEAVYLKLGPYMWEKLNDAIYDSNYYDIRNNIIAYLSSLRASEFNAIMKDVLAKDNSRGVDKIKKIGKEIEIDLRN